MSGLACVITVENYSKSANDTRLPYIEGAGLGTQALLKLLRRCFNT